MDCFRWARKEIGTALFPKAKEYQKLKAGAYGQEEDSNSEVDLYTTDKDELFGVESEAEDESEVEGESEVEDDEQNCEVEENFEEEAADKEQEQTEKNWWDSDNED
jgi:hypothetical protein